LFIRQGKKREEEITERGVCRRGRHSYLTTPFPLFLHRKKINMPITNQNNFFFLSQDFCSSLLSRTEKFGFGIFGEVVFYRTYSRTMKDGKQEKWADTVIRVVNGVMVFFPFFHFCGPSLSLSLSFFLSLSLYLQPL